MALWKIIPPEEGSDFCHRLVYHGREVCTARTKPYCDRCCLADICAKMEFKNGGNKEMRNAATDLTEGTPWKIIMRFSIPLFFTFLLQQFYNMVDTIVVGQFLGKDALAGVGSTGAINFMIIGFCMGLANGFVIPVAQRYGAKDYKDMRRFVANSIWLTVFLRRS